MKFRWVQEWEEGTRFPPNVDVASNPNYLWFEIRYHFTQTHTKSVGSVMEYDENCFSKLWKLYWKGRKKRV